MSGQEKNHPFPIGVKSSFYFFVAGIPVFMTFLIYLPSLRSNSFVNWDDQVHIQNNYHLHSLSLSSIQWMFTHFFEGNWQPLSWLSLALDYQIGGMSPQVFHVGNLILHCLNTALVFGVSLQILKVVPEQKEIFSLKERFFAALLTAILFGLHPLHVEVVAWATERNELLCGFFYLASLFFYLRYAIRPDRNFWQYRISLVVFFLALLSKPVAVTLPLVLVALDVWPLRRSSNGRSNTLGEKAPFFILAAGLSWATFVARSSAGSVMTIQDFSLSARVMNAFHSSIFYLWKMLAPMNLAAYYPITDREKDPFPEGFFWVALVLLALGFCFYFRKKYPAGLAVLVIYGVMLAPVLGIIQVGSHAAADRYAYLPSLGPFLLLSSAVAFLLRNKRSLFLILTVGLTAVLGYGTFLQAATWKDSIALWENVVKVSPGVSVLAYTKLGNAYQEAGRFDEAIAAYDQALKIDPLQAVPANWKGSALYAQGAVDVAIKYFKIAADLDPKDPLPHVNLCAAYQRLGQDDDALMEARKAAQLDPGSAQAFNTLAASWRRLKNIPEAEEAYQKAVSLDPGGTDYWINFANMYVEAGDLPKAIKIYQQAIAIDPGEVNYFLNLGYVCFQSSLYGGAIDALERALKLQPANAGIYQKLGMVYQKTGQNELAAQAFAKANALVIPTH